MIALHGGFISTEETIGSPLVGLGVNLKDRRTSGENEALPKILEADVRPRTWTYGPECDRGLYFHQLSHSSNFPYSRVVLVEIGLIEGFP